MEISSRQWRLFTNEGNLVTMVIRCARRVETNHGSAWTVTAVDCAIDLFVQFEGMLDTRACCKNVQVTG